MKARVAKGLFPAVLALLASGCGNDIVEPEWDPVWAVRSYTLAPDHFVLAKGRWVYDGGSHVPRFLNIADPEAVECRVSGGEAYPDCYELEKVGWVLLTEYDARGVIDIIRPAGCEKTNCISQRLIQPIWEDAHVQGMADTTPPADSILRWGYGTSWGYKAVGCGSTWVGRRMHTVSNGGGARRVPLHNVFVDTVWVTVTGC